MQQYLEPTWYLDWEAPAVKRLARDATAGAEDARDAAVRLYYAIRDGIRYDPYAMRVEPGYFRASAIVERDRDFCVPKAVLLAAAARSLGIPARLGFADVRNHLATERLLELMGTDVFAFHGYAELYLEGRWVKATPAFNLRLCEKAGVRPLEFDGREDSIFHEYDRGGRRHMEYLRDRGSFADLPYEEMLRIMRETYPGMMAARSRGSEDGDFEAEIGADSGRGGAG